MEALKDKLESSFLVFENELNGEGEGPIHTRRREAFERFVKSGFPTKRDEEWKYTNLKPVLKPDFRVFVNDENTVDFSSIKRFFLNDVDTYKLVFIDGYYSSWLSETTHQGFDICTFSNMLTKYKDVAEQYFGKALPENEAMASVNTAFAREGAFIRIKRNVTVDKPVEIIFITTDHGVATLAQPRNLVVVEENAEITILERHQSLSEQPVLTNTATEIFALRDSRLNYYKIQNDAKTASLIDSTAVRQYRGSNVTMGTYSFGNKFIRNNLNFFLEEEHTESHMDGITVIDEGQTVDHHTLADHKVPNCYSDELYKGIYDENAHGVFNGKVMVHPHAQKTNAFQQNNNILLTDKASIDTKPQLEIFADDVQCSHGCTIGQLDEEAMFYLRSRGIPEKEAKALLLYAFANDGLRNVKIPALRKKLNRQIAKKLNVNLDFEL
ncbi:Fe-S cluster assembly protein SufD [Croceimicrobium hydrocarbonivorans]|uniref:Fe-S cluster assembly protein SufD n=1 Tax=Croceimicrobium hydrocarbonivorans TaxID=2761580 RepID=A0A7H0VAI2_9FLAO|nr:Fe-S cluster assembly protein SufD [Croceimicrobium hydrocarbonivorans]QNR22730.1 Fe-S cluster assembly protein SufD [Croceimicrobium hydrocarbonivorans]